MAEEKKIITIITKYAGQGADLAKKALEKLSLLGIKAADNCAAAFSKAGGCAQAAFAKAAGGVQSVWSVLSGGMGVVQGVIDFFKESAVMAAENVRAVNGLRDAYQSVGYTSAGALTQAQGFASEMQRLTGLSDETFLNAQRQLANFGVVGGQAQEAIRAAFALSASQGISFETALQNIMRAASGSADALAEYGVKTQAAAAEGDQFSAVVRQINDQFGASAQSAMEGADTRLNALKESWNGFKEQVGGGLNETVSNLTGVLTWGVELLQKWFVVGENAYGRLFDGIIAGTKDAYGAWNGFIGYCLDGCAKLLSVGKFFNLVPESAVENVRSLAEEYHAASDALHEQADFQRKTSAELFDFSSLKHELSEQELADLNAQAEAVNAKRTAEVTAAHAVKDAKLEALTAVKEAQIEAAEEVKEAESNTCQEKEDKKREEEAKTEELITGARQRLQDLNKYLTDQEVKQKANGFLTITAALKQGSKEQMVVQKAQASAQALMCTYEMANTAYAAMSYIPVIGPALGIAAAAAATAYGLSNVANIAGIQLADGGLVKAVTGGIPAIIGEGGSDEAVLPLDNAHVMRRIGGAIAEETDGFSSGGVNIYQTFNITAGESLLGDITDAIELGNSDALRFARTTVKVGGEA